MTLVPTFVPRPFRGAANLEQDDDDEVSPVLIVLAVLIVFALFFVCAIWLYKKTTQTVRLGTEDGAIPTNRNAYETYDVHHGTRPLPQAPPQYAIAELEQNASVSRRAPVMGVPTSGNPIAAAFHPQQPPGATGSYYQQPGPDYQQSAFEVDVHAIQEQTARKASNKVRAVPQAGLRKAATLNGRQGGPGREGRVAPLQCAGGNMPNFGLVDSSLLGVLHRVGQQRQWSIDDLEKVVEKLHCIGVTKPCDLILLIRCGMLNTKLRQNRQKTMRQDTVRTIIAFLGLGKTVYLAEPAPEASCSQAILAREKEQGKSEFMRASIRLSRRICPPTTQGEAEEPEYPLQGSTKVSPRLCEPPRGSEPEPVFYDLEEVISLGEEEQLTQEAESSMRGDGVLDEPESRDYSLPDTHILQRIGQQAVWRVIEVPLSWLFFYQTTVAGSFSDGRSLQSTVDDLRSGGESPFTLPLMHCLIVDKKLYGMGTRRLLCYHHLWDATEPRKLIPVLFCNKLCDGCTRNADGLSMAVIGTTLLDGSMRAVVERRPPVGGTVGTCADLVAQYNRNIAPASEAGTSEVFYPRHLSLRRCGDERSSAGSTSFSL
ncbi:hypothetical protein DIPPA_10157 [Diplonema papillatum]|nr:hypothetical protein DIPPA_10157 [Diplonema papillatum]